MTFFLNKPVRTFILGALLSISAFAAESNFMLNAGFNIGALLPHFKDDMDNTVLFGGRLQADYAIKQNFSIGLESGFSTANVGDTDFSIGNVPVLMRLAWHPAKFEHLDPYFAGKAGYGFAFWTAEGDDYEWSDIGGGFVWGVSAGTRFFFSENVGVFVEAGYECLDFEWEHSGMELEKWEETVSARTFAVIGVSLR